MTDAVFLMRKLNIRVQSNRLAMGDDPSPRITDAALAAVERLRDRSEAAVIREVEA